MKNQGFTLIEVIVILALFATIMALPMAFLWGFGRSDTVIAAAKQVISIIHEAQTNAVTGRSLDGAQPAQYGVHFESTYYVYFRGSSYNAADATNERTDLDPGLSFSSIQFPSQNIIFERPTGKVLGFNPSQNYVEITDTNTNITKRITISSLGAITHD